MITKSIEYQAPTFSKMDLGKGASKLNSTGELLYMIVYDYEHADYPEKQQLRQKLVEKIKPILYQNKAPTFENGRCWGYMPFCASLALIKNKEELWLLFSEEDHIRMDQCMKMFFFMWQWGCNKLNYYRTGAGMHGDYSKKSGPNYQLTNHILYPLCAHYFNFSSVEQASEFFINADYDTEMESLRRLGMKNALDCWTKPSVTIDGETFPGTREIWNNGGEIYRKEMQMDEENLVFKGWGEGIKIEAAYRDVNDVEVDLPFGLIECIFNNTFNQTVVSDVDIEECHYAAGIADKTISPYEGQDGMMSEFNIPNDGVARRSSLWHCDIDFILVCCAIAAFKHLGIINIKEAPYWNKVYVGMQDYLYKKDHGYNSMCNGFVPNATSINIETWRSYWEEVIIQH